MFPSNVNFVTGCVPNGLWSCDAFSKWNLKLDILDLALGRDFFVSKYLSLRPNFGLRGVKVRQTQTSVYNGFNTSDCFCQCSPPAGDDCCFRSGSQIIDDDFQDRVKDRQKYWGVGPKAGMDTLWSFGGGWGIYGNAAISIVYGRLKVKHQETYFLDGFEDVCDDCGVCDCDCVCSCPVLTIKGPKNRCSTQYKSRAITDLALGLSWDRNFKDDRFHLGLNVGWEHHMFFGMNQFYRFMSSTQQGALTNNQGDLATQGLTFGARLDF